MRPLRFCFVTTFYPPHNFGGDGISIQRLARGLVGLGHRVTVLHDADAYHVLHEGDDPEAPDEPSGLEVVTLQSATPRLSVLITHQTGRPLVQDRAIRRVMEEGDFDVVNFHNVSLVGGPGILSYGQSALRLYMAHEHWLVCPMHALWRHGRERCTGRECIRCQLHYRRPPQLYRYTGYLQRQLDQVDTFIALSEFSRDKHREFGFSHPMEVLNPCLPEHGPDSPPDPDSPHDRPYFLFVGRLAEIKGLHTILPLFERYRDADLLVAGDGSGDEEARAGAREIPGVRFVGRVPADELRRYYAHALALVVPSVCFETFGMVLIEAFREGTPVLARRLGPFPEIIEASGGGALFDEPEDLLQAMHRIQTDPQHRRELSSAAARSFRERWSERVVVPRYLDIVRRTAARLGRGEIVSALSDLPTA